MNNRSAARRLAESEAWIFDLDNTLYPARANLFAQIERRMTEFVARFLGLEPDRARAVQKQYFQTHGTTLRGLMNEHGLEPRAFLDYVHDIDLGVLDPAPRLDRALERLPGRKLVFTNGSTAHAERVLGRLGLAHHFEVIFDIAAAEYRPKPAMSGYEKLCKSHGVRAERAVMVEDMARNLLPAHELGMATVLLADRSHFEAAPAPAHVHHLADDLEAFLEDLLPSTD